MSLIQKTIIVLGVTISFSGVSFLVDAQLSQPAQTQLAPPINNKTSPEINNQLSDKPDLQLLAKIITNFVKSDRYQTQSEMQITGTAPGLAFTSSVQIQTIVQSPRKFRSEIAFTQPGRSTTIKYLVVSNGNQVWIYRPDLKQYAVNSYEAFTKSNDDFLIGLSSSLFLAIAPDFKEITSPNPLSDANVTKVLEQLIQSKNPLIKGGRLNVQERDYYAYEYTDPKAGYTFSTLVAPETANVEQLQIKANSAGLDISVREKIQRRVENPVVTNNTFIFLPPKGTRRVKSIRLQPY